MSLNKSVRTDADRFGPLLDVPEDVISVGRWLAAVEDSGFRGRITQRWRIVGESQLGVVKWLSKWRRYAFFPVGETAFEPECLRDLATFCEKQTLRHKEARRNGN